MLPFQLFCFEALTRYAFLRLDLLQQMAHQEQLSENQIIIMDHKTLYQLNKSTTDKFEETLKYLGISNNSYSNT